MKLAELLKNDTLDLIRKSQRVNEAGDFEWGYDEEEAEVVTDVDPVDDEYDDVDDEYDPDDADAEGVDYEAIAHELVATVEETGGFTLEANSFAPAELTTGYQVAIEEYESRTSLDDIGAVIEALQEIAAYINQQSNTNLYVGGWYDDEAGELVLDVSQHVTDLDHAIALGKARNQIAIFDNSNMEDINVDGSGTENDYSDEDEYSSDEDDYSGEEGPEDFPVE